MAFEEILKEQTINFFKDVYGVAVEPKAIQLQDTRKEFEGDFTLTCFQFASITKKSPEASAEEIGAYLKEKLEIVSGYNVVKGFLNLVLSDQYWLDFFKEIKSVKKFGFQKSNGETVMIESASPNTNKPLHLGHIRNILLGDAVAKILEANGSKVIKVQIINDRGIHICKSMLAWQKFGHGETPESTGLKGDKLVGKYYVEFDKKYKEEISTLMAKGKPEEEAKKEAPILLKAQAMLKKWEAKDKEVYALWQKMNSWVYDGFDVTYKSLGVDFDKLYYESDTYLLGKDIVLKGVDKGIFIQEADGSVWCDLEPDGLDKKILLRSDGTSVYMTQDIGTAILRFNDFPNISKQIYTVGNEQDYHFKVLFLILKKLGYKWAEDCYHLSYGMVDLPEGKMKSREGTVVDADDLVADMISDAKKQTEELGKTDELDNTALEQLYQTIGMGALKYFLLKVEPKKRMLFDPKESIDLQGDTGPFIQYTYARIQAIKRRATTEQLDDATPNKLCAEERALLNCLYKFPVAINEAAQNYSPATIANYVYQLAKIYNKFYTEVPIFKTDKPQKHLIDLSDMVGKVIKNAMGLLGIEVPERM